MSFLNNFDKILKIDITFIELFVYFVFSLILFPSILYVIYYYFRYRSKGQITTLESKIKIGNTISLILSFILSVEILKIYYIKSYKQLIIITTLLILKLLINYFLTHEIEEAEKQKKEYIKESM